MPVTTSDSIQMSDDKCIVVLFDKSEFCSAVRIISSASSKVELCVNDYLGEAVLPFLETVSDQFGEENCTLIIGNSVEFDTEHNPPPRIQYLGDLLANRISSSSIPGSEEMVLALGAALLAESLCSFSGQCILHRLNETRDADRYDIHQGEILSLVIVISMIL
jgi:hypothetical protein